MEHCSFTTNRNNFSLSMREIDHGSNHNVFDRNASR